MVVGVFGLVIIPIFGEGPSALGLGFREGFRVWGLGFRVWGLGFGV